MARVEAGAVYFLSFLPSFLPSFLLSLLSCSSYRHMWYHLVVVLVCVYMRLRTKAEESKRRLTCGLTHEKRKRKKKKRKKKTVRTLIFFSARIYFQLRVLCSTYTKPTYIRNNFSNHASLFLVGKVAWPITPIYRHSTL